MPLSKFYSLRPLNISWNFIFLANYVHYVKFNSKYGFSKSQNIEKLVLHLILVVKLADIWDFYVPVAAILDCSLSGHQGHTPTCLRWFLETYIDTYHHTKFQKLVTKCTIWPLYDIFLPCYSTVISDNVQIIAGTDVEKLFSVVLH